MVLYMKTLFFGVERKSCRWKKIFVDGKSCKISLSDNIVDIKIGTIVLYINAETEMYHLVEFLCEGKKDQNQFMKETVVTNCFTLLKENVLMFV